ncbi:MAG TPA: hypothetical protein VMU80_08455 [Bryobacteraceae bacterium]|nr:hypothetical protein [Bryobacteraceae bacterium]
MRRVPAILLVCVISYSLIGPALFSGAESELPACCRRDGKHHCAMMNMDEAPAGSTLSGPSIGALKARCPNFPKGGVLLPQSAPALLATAIPAHRAMVRELTIQAQAEAGYRVSVSRSHQKRGPPSFLS